MAGTETQRKPIHLLSADVARKIAAGEVVDRPAALVRELIDNALDAQARTIEVQVEGGGARRTEVIDDGIGMTKEDLALCWLPHATSKVDSLEDLLQAETLGFRGEALAAITAVAQVEILTSIDGREAWLLSVGPGGFDRTSEAPERCISQARRVQGTTVRVLRLFDSVPARKKFLKRDGAEALLCRQAFIDKSMAFPDRTFRFVQEGELKLFFPPAASYRERFIQTQCEEPERGFVHEVYARGEGFTVAMVIGGPELYRHDRRQQFVFANGRRIQDFALLQALEYGLQGAFPNGTHPVGALFINIDPALADFNIHPAKREVRFKDPAALHHAITGSLRQFMHSLLVRGQSGTDPSGPEVSGTAHPACETGTDGSADLDGFSGPEGIGSRSGPGTPSNRAGPGSIRNRGSLGDSGGPGGTSPQGGPAVRVQSADSARLALEALLEHPPEYRKPPRPLSPPASPPISPPISPPASGVTGTGASKKTMETTPGEVGDTAAIQGARYVGRLFELFILAEAGDTFYIIDQHAAHERILYDRLSENPVQTQELLIPLPFTTDSEGTDRFLQANKGRLAELGIVLEVQGMGNWIITALPANWKKGDEETIRDILELEQAGEAFGERWLATMACHMAIKDGDYIDEITAQALIEAALALPIPRCPHGRPIRTTISRDQLFKAVRRSG